MPSPIDVDRKGASAYQFVQNLEMSSLFGTWQLPLTLHYTSILGRLTDLPLCAGGGLISAREALELIMLGATAVQYATAILVHGYSYIHKLVADLDALLDSLGYGAIRDAQGLALREQHTDVESAETIFEAARVTVDHNQCTMCRQCLTLAFCEAICEQNNAVSIDPTLCDGCGFCTHFCESKALKLESFREQ